MCNIYLQEKALEDQQRQRMLEIEQRHNVALAKGNHNNVRHIIGRSGTFLVMLGRWLEHIERREAPVQV